MLREEKFWESNRDALLMKRNGGFVKKDDVNAACSKFESLLDLVPAQYKEDIQAAAKSAPTSSGNEEMDRLFYQDAVRTFIDEEYRSREVKALNAIYAVLKDYHQGLGFIVSFLLLFLPHESVVTLALYMNDHIQKGYFKTHNVLYLRDARVFDLLLKQSDPEVNEKINDNTVCGAYCSKWFIGMCVHVLPFEALSEYFHFVLSQGEVALFQFGLSLCRKLRANILNAKDPATITAILRLDPKDFPDDSIDPSKQVSPAKKAALPQASSKNPPIGGDSAKAEGVRNSGDSEPSKLGLTSKGGAETSKREDSLFMAIVEEARDIKVSEDDIERFRKEISELMADEEEKRRKHAEQYSDDEIVFSDEE